MRRLIILLMTVPLIIHAQEKNTPVDSIEPGIKWVEGLSWQQVKEKARAENKYIFIDAYASWCIPCKMMDRDIYSLEIVGNHVNDKFIAIKIQMDTAKNDIEKIKNWYKDAQFIKQKYNVDAFPSFLFFSPDGRIVHKAFGYKNKNDFTKLISNAIDPSSQYFTLLENYNQGRMNFDHMPMFIALIEEMGDKKLASKIRLEYLNNYLYKQEDLLLYKKENITILRAAIENSKEKGFDIFYPNGDKVDTIMNHKGYSQQVVDFIISKEEIYPKLWRDNNPITNKPDWKKINAEISNKYGGNYADRTILNAQIRWYSSKKDWPNVIKYQVRKIEKYGLDTTAIGSAFVNNMIYNTIFMHSKNKTVLKKAIEWMEIIIKKYPDNDSYMDTYANLLYKSGQVKEALIWEKKSADISNDQEVLDNYEKMKKGKRTWSE